MKSILSFLFFVSALNIYAQCTINKADNHICLGDSKTLEILNISPGDAVTWSPATGLSATNIQNPIANPTATQMYTMTSACGTDSILIIVDTLGISVSPEDTFLCAPSLTILEAEIEELVTNCNNQYYQDQVAMNLLVDNGNVSSFTLSDNAVSDSIYIPFYFEMYCAQKRVYQINSNGFIAFQDMLVAGDFTPLGDTAQNIPNSDFPNDIIALAWADMLPNASTTFRSFTVGSLPNRTHVIEFANLPYKNDTATMVTGQIQLFESSNIIEIHASRSGSTTVPSTMGMENITGIFAEVPLDYNLNTFVSINEAWRFTPENSPTNFAYEWISTPPIANNEVLDLLLSAPSAGEYIFSVTNRNGCVFQDTVNLDIYETNTSLPASMTKCEGLDLQFPSSGADTYLWSPNLFLDDNTIANPTTSVDSNMTYYIIYTTNGCIQEDSVKLFPSINPSILEDEVRNILCCNNDTLQIAYNTFIQNYDSVFIDGIWESSDSLTRISQGQNTTDNFVLMAKNNVGCEASANMSLETKCIEPVIMVSDMDLYASKNFTTSFNEGSEISTFFSWATTDTSFNAITNPFDEIAQFNAREAGTYSADLSITQNFNLNNGSVYSCTEMAETQTYSVLSVGIEENKLDAELKLFPNPSAGLVYINFSKQLDNIELKIVNTVGQNVYKKSYSSIQNISLDLNLEPGIYFLQLTNEQNEKAILKLTLK